MLLGLKHMSHAAPGDILERLIWSASYCEPSVFDQMAYCLGHKYTDGDYNDDDGGDRYARYTNVVQETTLFKSLKRSKAVLNLI